MTPTRDNPRTVPLNKSERLVLAYNAAIGAYEVAYYRLRRLDEQGEPEKRFANRAPRLDEAIWKVLDEGEAPHCGATVEAYIRATVWGAQLP